MITKEMIDRINWLAYKKKTLGLSETEQEEQKKLYREYLDAFRANLKAQLDAIEIVDDKLEGFQKFQLFQLNLGILLPTIKARLREYIIFGK